MIYSINLLKQSNKIPIVQEKLNLIQNSFENCVKHRHKISDCYNILSMNSYRISNGIFDTLLTYNLLQFKLKKDEVKTFLIYKYVKLY